MNLVTIPTKAGGTWVSLTYDGEEVAAWVDSHDLPGNLVPADGLRIDHDAEEATVVFQACDEEGKRIIDRAGNRFLTTEPLTGRWTTPPPQPVASVTATV